MDLSTLKLLARTGFTGVPANRLEDMATWCDDWCRATGDARYCILGSTFSRLHEWWSEHDRYNGIPVSLAQSINESILNHLNGILAAQDHMESANLAAIFEREITQLLTLSYPYR